jgi:hypothetical protein
LTFIIGLGRAIMAPTSSSLFTSGTVTPGSRKGKQTRFSQRLGIAALEPHRPDDPADAAASLRSVDS